MALGSTGDAVLLAGCALWKKRNLLLGLIDPVLEPVVKTIVLAVVSLLVFRLARLLGKSREVKIPQWVSPAKPMLFPCQTTHTRLFPKKHSFAYSYLMVGIPVGWEGVAGGMISTGNASSSKSRKGWYQIDAADYLERGNGHIGLRGKLDSYLESQGVGPSQYPYAYLVTAAKFLGYHFNPVSFWYLYSTEKDMTAVILEVNNTFDERRMYFLPSSESSIKALDDVEVTSSNMPAWNGPKKTSPKPLRRAWPKDFHVSPFNSRKGDYSLVSHDPLAPSMEGNGSIDSTINLSSSKEHTKLVARIISEGPALDPGTMSAWQKLKFLSAWWWVGFVTFPRIVKEAGALFFKRKLHVWYRPEPLKQSMGRRADETERQLETLFRRYLRYMVDQCPAALVVHYVPSGLSDTSTETMTSPAAKSNSDLVSSEEMEFNVLTPAFYSRFIHYAHDLEAVFCELNESRTIWVSRPELLPKLVLKKPPPPLHTSSYLDYGYFKLIQRLRQRPERIERPMTSSQPSSEASDTHTKVDIRDFRLASMDGYVLAHEDGKSRQLYRSLVLKLFVANGLAMGSVELLWLEQLFVRVLLAWLLI
ncbi:uncharacterized protein BCR38DRAFT_457599 [Pseudomassariella vexata]|uniref:Cyclopropane-fatty-acyl-phospholipid synthase n=1 Tax=Pseudomassariella vexata TaxID=1141098 RepID=A0A1Y2E1M1_9PEZI|nr:uncharacterized protein BCR38DRAFT_457599 [Pseudomassariella vexata]ORY65448.1 hypothetical protein BCR38DRAFT_457599 [Pseudomassariella vexata]